MALVFNYNLYLLVSTFGVFVGKDDLKSAAYLQKTFQNESYSVVHFLSEMRCQLGDQLKAFDTQLEQKSQQLQDLMDYLRRRGEIESEYARSLEKLAERFTSRIKR